MPSPVPSSAGRLLFRGLLRNKVALTASFGLLSLWQLCESMVPVLIGVIIDKAVAPSDLTALAVWGAAFVALFAVLSYAYRFGSRIAFRIVQQEMHRIRVEIAAHVLDARGARTGRLPGETLSLATADAELVAYLIRFVGFTVASVVAIGVSAWVLIGIDVTIGVVVLVGVPVSLLIVQVATPAISRRTQDQQASIAEATGIATDLVRGLRVLKGIGGERVASDRYRRHSQGAMTASIRTADSFGVLSGLTVGLSGLFLALVALLAGQRALDGTITIGELVAIVGLTQFLAEPIRWLGELSAQAASSYASAKRVLEFLHTPRLVESGSSVPTSPAPTITLRGVSAGALSGLDLESRPGELLGLAIEDPASAASLVQLLSGAVRPADESGEVLLDGIPFSDLTVDGRRDRVLVNPHHVDLFEGTLRTNVDPDRAYDDEGLAHVLQASAAVDVVELQENGLDQAVSPDGSTYSGGQRQRIALARALAARAPILVLHDPTTAVDAVTEHRIAEGVRELRHPVGGTFTTWVITNSPALLAQADRVVLIRDGKVVGEGTHHELVTELAYQELVLR